MDEKTDLLALLVSYLLNPSALLNKSLCFDILEKYSRVDVKTDLLAILASCLLKEEGTQASKSFWKRRVECKNLEELRNFLEKFIQDNK